MSSLFAVGLRHCWGGREGRYRHSRYRTTTDSQRRPKPATQARTTSAGCPGPGLAHGELKEQRGQPEMSGVKSTVEQRGQPEMSGVKSTVEQRGQPEMSEVK